MKEREKNQWSTSFNLPLRQVADTDLTTLRANAEIISPAKTPKKLNRQRRDGVDCYMTALLFRCSALVRFSIEPRRVRQSAAGDRAAVGEDRSSDSAAGFDRVHERFTNGHDLDGHEDAGFGFAHAIRLVEPGLVENCDRFESLQSGQQASA